MQAFSCWSVVGLLSLVANTIYDIQEIIFRLLKSCSCFINDILECLHCVALIFFVLSENRQDFFSRYAVLHILQLLCWVEHMIVSGMFLGEGGGCEAEPFFINREWTNK